MVSSPITPWQTDEGKDDRFYFLRLQNHCDSDCSYEIKMLAHRTESYDEPRQHIKKQTSLC